MADAVAGEGVFAVGAALGVPDEPGALHDGEVFGDRRDIGSNRFGEFADASGRFFQHLHDEEPRGVGE